MTELDAVIKNGVVVDGTGRPPFPADIGIVDGCIATIGEVDVARAAEVYDAEGRYVGPGFVDTHTHFDVQVFADPVCADANENGVTTVVMANCGFGLAPCRPDERERSMLMLESVEQIPVEQQRQQLPWTWETFPEFVEAVATTPKSINAACYFPINPALRYVMGDDAPRRDPSAAELAELQAMVVEAMEVGASGVSVSKLGGANLHRDHDGSPMPSDVMSNEAVVAILSVMRGLDRGVIQCLSGVPGGKEDQSIITQLAEASGRPVLQNLIPTSDFKPDIHVRPLQWLDEVNRGDIDVYAASFLGRGWTEVNVGTSAVHDADPNFRRLSFASSDEERIALLRDPDFRKEVRDAYRPQRFIGSNGVLERFRLADAAGCDEIEPLVGVLLGDVARSEGKHVVDVYLDVTLASDGHAWFNCGSLGSSDAQVTAQVLLNDKVIGGGSDGGAHLRNFNGTAWTTDLMTWLVRDAGVLSVEQAHHRFAKLPADLFGFTDRGSIEVGKVADLVVYDLDELFFHRDGYEIVEDKGGWRKRVVAGGYRWVFVCGEPTFEQGTWTTRTPGHFVRPRPPRP